MPTWPAQLQSISIILVNSVTVVLSQVMTHNRNHRPCYDTVFYVHSNAKKRERHIAHVFYIAWCKHYYILVSLPLFSTMILEAPQLIIWKPWSSHPVILGCFYLWMIDNNLWSDFCRDSSVTIF